MTALRIVIAHCRYRERGGDIPIRELAEIIMCATELRAELAFDAQKPDSAPRKLLDVSRMRELGWSTRYTLHGD